MQFRRRVPVSSSSAVLLVSHEMAEWWERAGDGAARYGSAAVLGAGAEDVARAALEARAAAGGAARGCVVVLGGTLVEQRTLPLPELGRNDLIKVLPRKAAALLDVTASETLYAALPFAKEQPSGGESAREQKWYLVAMRRSFMTALAGALRRERLQVQRMVHGPLARLCCADEVRGAREEACIVVDVERDAVVVSLIAQDALRLQNQIRGSFESVPTMALSLIQEIKSFDGFWRKLSRGQAVNQVVVIGVEFDRSRLFANAINAALPQAKVKLLPDEADLQGADRKTLAGRSASLAACSAQGPFQLDLTVHLQARHAYVFTLAGCLLLVTGGIGVVAHESMSRRLQTILENQRVLQGQASDLEDLRERNAEAEAALQRATAECERLIEAGELGVPLASALEGALLAVGPGGELTSFVADRDRYGGQVALAGLTDSDPLSSMRVLASMQGALERSPLFENVELEAPTLAIDQDGTLGSAAALEFEIAATWQSSAP